VNGNLVTAIEWWPLGGGDVIEHPRCRGKIPVRGARSARTASATRTQQGPARILVVEDDFLIALQTKARSDGGGFPCRRYCDHGGRSDCSREGSAALLAVMDIRLASERDGIDAARELFSELDIRCIFATAHHDPRTRERAEPYAPLGWLPKPYTTASLIALVVEARSKLD
jgi:DNA-binding NarL/FixJ family response regulator